jgi:hypothetical protein
MTNAKNQPRKRQVDRGGLPDDDDDLSAFAAKAAEAFGKPGVTEPRPALAAVPATVPAAPPPQAAPQVAEPALAPQPSSAAPAAYRPPVTDEPDDDEATAVSHGDLIRQATISVDANVAERFRRYQKREARNGPAPSNAEVVFRALDAAAGRYAEVVASRMPQPAPGRHFGAPVPGRRVSSEARLASQINYRPTYGEIAEIKRLQKQAGARSVSAFLDAALDAFLPPLKRAAHSTQDNQET